MSGNSTLLAGFTAPLSDTAPDSNHPLNSAALNDVAQALPAFDGGTTCVSAQAVATRATPSADSANFMFCDFMMVLQRIDEFRGATHPERIVRPTPTRRLQCCLHSLTILAGN